MLVLVVYDVNTETRAGRRRLRQVARVCLGFGDRVQKSVFECRLTEQEASRLLSSATSLMDPVRDSLRLYRIASTDRGPWRCYGVNSSPLPVTAATVL